MYTITIQPLHEQKNSDTDSLRFNSNEDKSILRLLHNTPYQYNSTNSANSFFTKNFSWEYFSNELEFE